VATGTCWLCSPRPFIDRTTVIIQAKKPELRAVLESQASIIIALTKGAGTVKYISEDSEIPHGVGTEVVTADITVHIPVQGKVDASAEIDKLEKKEALAVGNKEKLRKVIEQPNYETTVREDVRAGNVDKVGSSVHEFMPCENLEWFRFA
jgi:valyl-tRNA synthetase